MYAQASLVADIENIKEMVLAMRPDNWNSIRQEIEDKCDEILEEVETW